MATKARAFCSDGVGMRGRWIVRACGHHRVRALRTIRMRTISLSDERQRHVANDLETLLADVLHGVAERVMIVRLRAAVGCGRAVVVIDDVDDTHAVLDEWNVIVDDVLAHARDEVPGVPELLCLFPNA